MESYAHYLWDAVWPTRLAAFYPHPLTAISAYQVAGAVLLLLCITGASLRLARSQGYLPVGWFWYLGMLVPVIGLVQVGMQARADRYMYLPLVGLCIPIAWGVPEDAWDLSSPRTRRDLDEHLATCPRAARIAVGGDRASSAALRRAAT